MKLFWEINKALVRGLHILLLNGDSQNSKDPLGVPPLISL